MYAMEVRIEPHEDYCYPKFVEANWYAATKIINLYYKGIVGILFVIVLVKLW